MSKQVSLAGYFTALYPRVFGRSEYVYLLHDVEVLVPCLRLHAIQVNNRSLGLYLSYFLFIVICMIVSKSVLYQCERCFVIHSRPGSIVSVYHYNIVGLFTRSL